MLFLFLTAETFVAGALLPMAAELRIPPRDVGSLMTVYAIVAALTIIPVTALTLRVPVKILLPIAMLALATSGVVMYLAPSLGWMIAARSLAAVFHGVVWASAPAVAAWMVPEHPGRATSYVFIGSSLGNLLGAPAVAAISDAVSWRVASLASAGLAALCGLVLLRTLPKGNPPETRKDTARTASTGTASRSSVAATVLWCCVILLISAAHVASFTYVAQEVQFSGLPAGALAPLLLGMGAVGLLGNLVVGRTFDSHATATLTLTMVLMTVGLLGTRLPAPWFVGAALVWAAAYAAATVVVQAAVLQGAQGWARIASAWYVLTFQIGIASGSALGGYLEPMDRPGFSGIAAALALVVFGVFHSVRSKSPDRSLTVPTAR
jgi:predicted MFS family arabinose efflux permease